MSAEQPLCPEQSLDVSISRAETELVRLLDWVRAAESRLALVLPLSTAMLGALAVLVPTTRNSSLFSAIFSSGATLFLILSIAFAAWACFPKTIGPSGSLIFFGTIAAMKLNQYEQEVSSMTSADYLVDVIRQCHRNAQIANYKYAWIQRSMICLLFATPLWVVSIYILSSART